MPKVGRMTDLERRAEEARRIIEAGCKMHDCRNLTGLAEAIGEKSYSAFYSRLRRGKISALQMNDIIHILGPEVGAKLHKV